MKSNDSLAPVPANACEDSLKYIPPVEAVEDLYIKSLVNLASKKVLSFDGSPKTSTINHRASSAWGICGACSGFGLDSCIFGCDAHVASIGSNSTLSKYASHLAPLRCH